MGAQDVKPWGVGAAAAIAAIACQQPEQLVLAPHEERSLEATGAASLKVRPIAKEQTFDPARQELFCSPRPSSACALDSINDLPARDVSRVAAGSTLRLGGWAADFETASVPPVVALRLVGKTNFDLFVEVRGTRPDVAETLKLPSLWRSGWEALAAFRAVEPGEYAVHVLSINSLGNAFFCDTKRMIRIE